MPFDFRVGPTVGRESALERFDATLDALEAGESGCIALDGEPGIGKTHLLTELQRLAEERGYLVLGGSATEFERDLPFAVWADALDAYVASQELELGESWSTENARELADILPSLRRPAESPGSSVPDERYRAHRASRKLLELLARDRPLVVVLDDLHWADEASIELLAALLRRGPEAPVLLALGFRRAQAPARLSAALASFAVGPISLEPLTEAEVNELLAGVEPRTAAAIYRHGGGNPFYLHQLRRAGEEGRLDAVLHEGGGGVAVSGTPVPSAVAASLAEELASLPVGQLVLLRAAAVAGEPFEPDLAAAIAELPPSDGLDALDALAGARSDPSDLGAAAVRLSPPPRATRGLRIGACRLEARGTRTRGRRARRRAALRRPSAPTTPSSTQGGVTRRQSVSCWRPERPRRRERRPRQRAGSSRRCACCPPATNARSTCALPLRRRCALSGSSTVAGPRCSRRTSSCRRTRSRAGSSSRRTAPRSSTGSAVTRKRIDACHAPGRSFPTARRPRPRRSRSSSRWTASTSSTSRRQWRWVCVRWRRRARSAIGPLIAAAAAALCLAETTAGHVVDAGAHRREARAEVDALSDAELAPRLEALYHLAWAETYLEHYDDAVAHAERGIAIARAFGQGRLLVPLSLAKNFPFEMQGRLRDAIELCESALEAARLSASAHELYRALFELGWTLYYAGDLDGALAAHEESSRVDPRLAGGTIPNGGGGPGWGLGVAWLESGEIERGRTMLLELGGENVARTMPVERCFDWESLTLAELAVGDVDAADGYARRAEQDAAQLALKLPSALAGRARAAVLLARGEPLEAARVAHESAEAAGSVGANLQAAFSRGLEGRALAAAGDRLEAIATLRRAERELDACGSVRVRDEMRRELRRLGARAEPRGPAAPGDSGIDSLSKRELEIAGLVTDRLTNREIAAALFLSDKTIESHLRNIFHKLGVTSRVEVARAVERERAASAGAQA